LRREEERARQATAARPALSEPEALYATAA
jgi:hypothetical protein